MKRYILFICLNGLIYAQELSPGREELVRAYGVQAKEQKREQAIERARAEERQAAMYRDIPTQEEAAAEGTSYWSREEAIRAPGLRRERAGRAGAYSEEYYRQHPTEPQVMAEEERVKGRKAAQTAAFEERAAAYAQMRPEIPAQEAAKYQESSARMNETYAQERQMRKEREERRQQLIEERSNQINEAWEKEVEAAISLRNILKAAQYQEDFERAIAEEAEKAERAAALTKQVIKKIKRAQKTEEIAELQKAEAAIHDAQDAADRIVRAAEYQALFEDASLKFNIEYAKKQLEEARNLMKKQQDIENLLERSAEQGVIEAEFERKKAAFIEEDKRAAQIRDLIERSAEHSAEQWQKSPRRYVDKVVHGLQDLWEQIKASQQHVGPALAQAAENVQKAVSDAITAIKTNMPWKDKVNTALTAVQDWYKQARMSLEGTDVIKWMKAHAAPIPPGAGAEITRTFPSEQPMRVELQTINTYVAGYRKAVRDYETFKKQGITSAQAAELTKRFNTIRVALDRDAALKGRVTSRIVPLFMRAIKGSDVLIAYIDGYIRNIQELLNKSENQAATAQLQAQLRGMPTAQS